MELPDESLRPHKAVATPPGEPTLRVPLSDDEWREHLQREIDFEAKKAEAAKTQHLRDREEAYKKEVYPFLEEAMAAKELDGNPKLMNELKAKRKEIRDRFPEPAPEPEPEPSQ